MNNFIKNKFKLLVKFASLLSVLFILSINFVVASVSQSEYDWYGKPVKYNSTYILDAEAIILKSMADRGWETKSKSAGEIIAWLSNKSNNEIIFKEI